MDSNPAGQILTVFRSRLRHDAEANGYRELAESLEKRARRLPGFVDFKSFAASDGERVSIVTFASAETHRAWRDDLEHREAQRRGRSDFYDEYEITVGPVAYRYRFGADPVEAERER